MLPKVGGQAEKLDGLQDLNIAQDQVEDDQREQPLLAEKTENNQNHGQVQNGKPEPKQFIHEYSWRQR